MNIYYIKLINNLTCICRLGWRSQGAQPVSKNSLAPPKTGKPVTRGQDAYALAMQDDYALAMQDDYAL